MPALTLHLLGPGVLAQDGQALRTHSARTFALLAFLVLEPGRPHARSTLVELIWNDLPAASGRQSLRQALYSLRSVADGQLNECLRVDARWVQFNLPAAGSAIAIDVRRLVDGASAGHEAQWRDASAVPLAPLLEGLSAVPGNDFETWLLGWRERLHALALQNLGRLVVADMARGAWASAAGFAQAMSALDPGNELAAQHLLKIRVMQGSAQAVEADAEAMVRAGQAAERVHAFGHSAELYERALQSLRRDLPSTAPRCFDVLMLREAMLERLGRRGEQCAVIAEAMRIANDLGDLPGLAQAQLRQASACTYLGRHPEALAAAGQALQIFRDLADAPGQAEALREIGFVHWHAQDHRQALAHSREALQLHRRIGDVTGEATALHNLAQIYRGLGSPRQAARWFEQAMQLHWAARNPVGEILSLFGWAGALREAGEPDASRQKLEAALKLSERSGERTMFTRALQALALHHASLGALDPALELMRQAINVDRTIGYAHALGHDLVALAGLHVQRGELAEARVALQEALVWQGFTQDADAQASTRERLHSLDSGLAKGLTGASVGIKSHLALGEGKVYCEFESPARRAV
ncbi:MAG: tetratricopeptide repeat protein [Burkholderiaceae bacterium]|nr:tetratricopeptide repeat protein [Burkholderiaceae bacterium]